MAEERDAIAQAIGLVEVVRAEEDGASLAAKRDDELAHRLRGVGIEAGRRLVEEQDARLVQRRPRNGHLLLHAARERRHRLEAALPQSHHAQETLRLRTRGRAAQAVERRVEDEVLPCRLALVEAGLLGEDADLRADLRVLAAEAEPRDLGATRRRRDERAQ